MVRQSFYANRISELTDTDPRHIEAWMRLSFGTLDSLSREDFEYEVECATRVAREAPEESEALALSYGL